MITVIQHYSLSDIKKSIQYLLRKSSSSPEVRELAVAVTLQSSPPSDKISAVYDWVKTNVQYVPDPVSTNGDLIELFISPVKMVRDYKEGKSLAGDCDDLALLTTALCRSIGITSRVVLVDIDGKGISHAFCEAYSEKLNDYIAVDPSSEYPLGWVFSFKEKIVID